MDSEMWALGLLLIPVIGYAIVIFLIIKLIKFIKNKTKKNESNNITINYNTQKENTVKIEELENDININKKKTNLYKTFIILSIIISIFLLPFVSSMTSKFPTAYPGNEALSGVITSEIANQIAIYVWPVLIVYIVMLIILIIKKTNYRKVYYPLSLFTLTIIIINLGIIYSGMNFMWYLVGLSPSLTILLIILGVIGNKLDNNTIKKKTAGVVLISAILLLLVVPLLDFTGIGSKLGTYITASNYELVQNVNFEIEEISNNKINIYFYNDDGYYYSVARQSSPHIERINVFLEKKSQKRVVGMVVENDELKRAIYIIDYKGGEKLVYEHKNKITQEFNNILNKYYISIYELKLDENNSIKDIELLINDNKISENETDFCNSLIEMYVNIKPLLNKYNYTSQTIHFEFVNTNPFAKTTHYKNGGYIRVGEYSDSDRNWYHIYLNSTPIKIN